MARVICRRIARAALPALVLFAVGVGATPAAAVSFGLQITKDYSASDAQRMSDGGADQLRMVFNWGKAEPQRNRQFDLSATDDRVADAARAGLRVLPILVGTPTWAKDPDGARSEAWPLARGPLAHFQDYARAVVSRYGKNGSFWRDPEYAGVPYLPIVAWQVWNEPNLAFFSPDRKARVGDYARLLNLTSRAIKGVESNAKVLLAGMPEHRHAREGKSFRKFMTRLAGQADAKRNFDVAAIHPYGRTSEAVLTEVLPRMTRAVSDAFGRKREIWVTEFGWGTGGAPSPYRTTAQGQAGYLGRTMVGMTQNAERWNLGRAFVYSWRDTEPTVPGDKNWPGYTGMFDLDGNKKFVWDVFAYVTGGNAGGQVLEGSPADEADDPPQQP